MNKKIVFCEKQTNRLNESGLLNEADLICFDNELLFDNLPKYK